MSTLFSCSNSLAANNRRRKSEILAVYKTKVQTIESRDCVLCNVIKKLYTHKGCLQPILVRFRQREERDTSGLNSVLRYPPVLRIKSSDLLLAINYGLQKCFFSFWIMLLRPANINTKCHYLQPVYVLQLPGLEGESIYCRHLNAPCKQTDPLAI